MGPGTTSSSWHSTAIRCELLHWDRQGGLVPVFPEEGRPTLLVPADLEKGHADRILPIATEFALFLLETPIGERTGPVFRLPSRESIETTLRYYVGTNAARTAEACSEAYEKSLLSRRPLAAPAQPVVSESPAAA
jgi:hypothetical protein